MRRSVWLAIGTAVAVTLGLVAPAQGAAPVVQVTSASFVNGAVGSHYAAKIRASGQPVFTWQLVAGGLPDGLTLSRAGIITGTPTRRGTWSFTPQVTDRSGAPATRALKLKITPALAITSTKLTSGPVGTAFQRTLHAAGGTTPYVWTLVAGPLPAGLRLTRGGNLRGTPTQSVTSRLTAEVTDATGHHARKAFSLTITAPSVPPKKGRWIDLPNMPSARSSHSAIALPDGDVLIVGGERGRFRFTSG